ncbi:MAG: cyclic nucleotide-binding/CBS domain-containing protein [Desulfacinum sp.]|nr:cyclic nucleotide-binding/CBS domain-containing protein [Desulfacinum sp.]
MIPPKEFLRKIKPFSFLEEAQLNALVSGLDVVMHPADTVISRQGEISPAVYLVFSGLVGLYDGEDVVDYVAKGEIFGLLSAVHQAPSYYEARTLEETICYTFDAAKFAEVYRTHSAFASFFSAFVERRFRAFSRLAREGEGSEEASSLVEVGTLLSKAPVTCTADATVADAVSLMEQHKVGSVIVVEGAKPVGILTNRDMRRVLIHGGRESRVRDFMSSPPICLDRQSPVFDAYTQLLRTGIDHLIVVDGDRVAGVVTSKDILAQLEPSSSILALYRKVIKATDLEALQSAFRAIRLAVSEMALKGMHFYQLSRMITSVYDMVVIRIIEFLKKPEETGDFLWIHLGSSGRKEQVITTDQDNAVILGPSGPRMELVQRINEALEQVGVPKCPAQYMASNPKWHLTLQEWKELFSRWFEEPTPDHIRYLTVFLDMRTVYGDAAPLEELLEHIHASATNQAVRFLAHDATLSEPPIGIFGIKHLDRGVNLKKFGIYPIANGVRVLALDHKLLHITNTRERIEALRDMKALGEERAGDLLEAYAFLQDLRLRHQAHALKNGVAGDNLIRVEELDKMDLLVLKESLKITASFQKMLKARYGVERGL